MSNKSKIIPAVCHFCKRDFLTTPDQIRRGIGKFCSRSCSAKNRAIPHVERFWGHIGAKNDRGCILWDGGVNHDGYGFLVRQRTPRRIIFAHRLAYELMIGQIPDGMKVCHHCDNPPCINPVHLFLGTDDDNSKDKVSKGRQYAKLTPDLVRQIRDRSHERTDKLAVEFEVTESSIRNVRRGTTWGHIPLGRLL